MRAAAVALVALAACKDAAPPSRGKDAAPAPPSLDGVWREANPATPWTHRVFAGATTRMVDEAFVTYDDAPALEATLELSGDTMRVQQFRVADSGQKFLQWSGQGRYELAGDRLTIHWQDGVETLVREPDAAIAKRVAAPPVAVPHPTYEQAGLGTLRWDQNVAAWEVDLMLDEHGPATVSFKGEPSPPVAFFAKAKATVDALRESGLERARAFSADQLLDTYNGQWRDDRERLDKAGFMGRLWIEGINVAADGTVEVFFYDSDMFFGKAVKVPMDAAAKPLSATLIE